LIVPVTVGATANIALSFLLVSRQGILGAARASCLSYIAQFLVTALLLSLALRRRRQADRT